MDTFQKYLPQGKESYIRSLISFRSYEGWDNPFRPDGEISHEAEELLKQWKRGNVANVIVSGGGDGGGDDELDGGSGGKKDSLSSSPKALKNGSSTAPKAGDYLFTHYRGSPCVSINSSF